MIFAYAGSFDPVTAGHLDVATRAAAECDHLFLLVARNPRKPGRHPAATRVLLLRQALAGTVCKGSVSVAVCDGLVACWARRHGVDRLVRGARGWRDWVAELPLAAVNAALGLGLPTRIYPAAPALRHVSSTAEWAHTKSLIDCRALK